RVFGALWLAAFGSLTAQTTYVSTGSTWSYLRGLAEASNPTSAWRVRTFVENGWSSGAAPFWLGFSGITGGTQLVGMGTNPAQAGVNHTSVFLRQTFNVPE